MIIAIHAPQPLLCVCPLAFAELSELSANIIWRRIWRRPHEGEGQDPLNRNNKSYEVPMIRTLPCYLFLAWRSHVCVSWYAPPDFTYVLYPPNHPPTYLLPSSPHSTATTTQLTNCPHPLSKHCSLPRVLFVTNYPLLRWFYLTVLWAFSDWWCDDSIKVPNRLATPFVYPSCLSSFDYSFSLVTNQSQKRIFWFKRNTHKEVLVYKLIT